jgi:glycosyltransferase involved in cell wall biosynthesis
MQPRNPFVSVILPTYNRAQTLFRAISSVMEQSFRDFELIVVDDGSSDETLALIDSFVDERLIYIRLTHNAGVSAARNHGIRASRGALIAFQDSDDEWLPQKLELQVARMRPSDSLVGVVYAPFVRIKPDSIDVYPKPRELLEGDLQARILYKNLVSAQMALVKRECFGKAGLFDENLPCLVDWELWIRISRAYHFKFVDQPLARVYFTAESISTNEKNLARAMEIIIRKHKTYFKSHPQALALHRYEIGVLLCLSGEFERGRESLLRLAKSNPGKPYFGLTALLSLVGEASFVRIYNWKKRFQQAEFPEAI